MNQRDRRQKPEQWAVWANGPNGGISMRIVWATSKAEAKKIAKRRHFGAGFKITDTFLALTD